nr:substrate-binding domain-containing protein [Pseudohalocynthiibacter aestuariivivens]
MPVAQETVNNLSDTRQGIRGAEFGRTAFQRIAVLHTISVNYLTKRIKELEDELPNLRVRVYSDYLPTCCQLFSDGTCDFLLCYRHNNGAPFFEEDLVARKDLGVEKLVPVAEAKAAAEGGWDISSKDVKNIPYLSYDPSSYLGTIVDQIIGSRQPPMVLRYMDAHSEALKRSAIAGSGVAWLSERVIADELQSGKLVRVGGPEWQTTLKLTLFCSLDRLDKTGQQLWEAL